MGEGGGGGGGRMEFVYSNTQRTCTNPVLTPHSLLPEVDKLDMYHIIYNMISVYRLIYILKSFISFFFLFFFYWCYFLIRG